MKNLKKISFTFFLIFILKISLAQPVFCPPNIDWEQANYSNWYLFTGACCPGNQINTPNLTGGVAGRHTITNATTPVDLYGGFPAVAPGGGNFSLKLGNNSSNSEAERARYYVRVPNNLNNYSLILRYAVVLQNPNHQPSDQPRFVVKAYDSATNQQMNCIQFTFISSSSLPGFNISSYRSDVTYKGWSTASLNLSGQAGKTIAVDFASGDCNLGGHFGYGYIDLNCGLFQISGTLCKGTATSTLVAPPGFQYYKWYDSTFTTLLGTTPAITVATPATFNKYKVILTPYPGYGCADTLTTTITVSDLKLKVNGDTTICKVKTILLNDSVSASAKFQPITYQWTPITGLSCTTCLNPFVTPPTTTRYKLKVTDVNGCFLEDSFTIFVKIHIDTQPFDKIVCKGDKAVFKVGLSGNGPYNFQWRKNGVNISAPSADSLVINNVGFTDTAFYDVIVTGDCDSVISIPVRLAIYPLPKITMQPQSIVFCPGKRAMLQMKATNSSPITYQWKKNGLIIPGATKDSLVFNPLTYSDSGFYSVMIKAECEYVLTDTIFLTVQLKTSIVSQPVSVSQCLGRDATFKVNASGTGALTYQWMRDFFYLFGSSGSSYYIPSMTGIDTGNYYVIIRSLCDSVISTKAKLTLNPPTKILIQPVDVLQCNGTNTKFIIKATGTPPVRFQWMKNGLEIPGATNDTLILNNISQTDIASYFCIVMGYCDTINSNVVSLNLFPVNNVNLPDTMKICTNNNFITLTGFTSYHWNTGSINNSIQITSEGKYWVRVTDNNSCVTSDTTIVKLMLPPIVDAGIDVTLCNKLDVNLSGTADIFNTSQWVDNSFGNFTDHFSMSTIFHPNSNSIGDIPLILSATNGCGTNYDTMNVTFTAPPDPDFIPADTVVCQKSKDVILTPIQNGGTFSGTLVRSNFFSPSESGLFTIHYKIELNGCTDSSTKIIRVVPLPAGNFNFTPRAPSTDSSVSFHSSGKNATSFLWTFGDGNSSTETNPVNYYTVEGYYTVVLYSYREFCSDSIQKIIRVRGSEFVWVPNAFTPNGDGVNDLFKVIYRNNNGGSLKVYNKWGQNIFTTTDLSTGWDGTFEGAICPQEVYHFVVEYINNEDETKHLTGNVTLLR